MEPSLNLNCHPSEETLELYALGRLQESELEQVDIHLLMCETCQDTVAEADQYVAALTSALAEAESARALPSPAAAVPKSPWWRNLQWMPPAPLLASGLAALLLAGVLLQSPPNLHPSDITLRSERGSQTEMAAQGPAGAPLDLHIQSSHIAIQPDYRLSIVDRSGTLAWSGQITENGAHVEPGLTAGIYWVRLYDGRETLLQEYGLQLD
jgi:hypothetical protein